MRLYESTCVPLTPHKIPLETILHSVLLSDIQINIYTILIYFHLLPTYCPLENGLNFAMSERYSEALFSESGSIIQNTVRL